MNRYLHLKVFIFVPKVDLTFLIDYTSDDMSYYEPFMNTEIHSIRSSHIYNVHILFQMGFWVPQIAIQFLPSFQQKKTTI